MKLAVLSAVLLLSACASGGPTLDLAQVEATCTRWCADTNPSCAFDGPIIEPKTEPLRACHKKYLDCVKSCPPR